MEGIFYTICPAPDFARTFMHLAQLRLSVESLRRVSPSIPIYIFTFGISSSTIEKTVKQSGIRIIEKGSYSSILEQYCGARTAVFSEYPVLHRWLVLEDLRHLLENTLLYVDCDTYFMADPAILTISKEFDWYTREEPCSSRSYLGYDPDYLNEKALESLAQRLSGRTIPPGNTGIILFKNRVWERIQTVLHHFFDYIWKFLNWMARYGDSRILADQRMQPILREVARFAPSDKPVDALPYPSSNGWIVDELSILLALGHLQQFSWGFLDRRQVLQGYEFAGLRPRTPEFAQAVLCHYYTKNHAEFLRWRELTDIHTNSRNPLVPAHSSAKPA
jgi:hypothetical protein